MNVVPFGQYFGATERRAMRLERRHAVTPAMPVDGLTRTRAQTRADRKARRAGDGTAVLASKKSQHVSKRQIFLGPPVGIGTGAGAGAGLCDSTATLGTCLQCCAHNYRGTDRRACKRACDARFAAGAGTCPGGCPSGYHCDNGNCVQDAGTPPTPGGSGCGIVCVSGTHGNQEDCHWECPDYGVGGQPAPRDLGGITPIGGGNGANACGSQFTCPDGSCAPDEASCPAGTGAGDFWATYQTPILIGGGILAAILAIRATKKGGR